MAARWAGRRLVAEAAARQLRACRTQGVSGVVGGEVAAPLLAHSGVIRHSAGAATAAAAAAGVASAQHARTTKQVCFNPVWAAAFAAGLTVFSTSTSLSFATAAAVADAPPKESTLTPTNDKDKHSPTLSSFKPTIVFVLGGPGAGKGTQCAKIVREYGFVHLSAGDLLRAEIQSGSENGQMIADMIKEGKIVPSWVTVRLLQKAVLAAHDSVGKTRFLIDGFPRNNENREAFERETGWTCDFVLFLDCPEDVMEKRLLNRGEGRTDDNAETIKKRFKVFIESSMPVLDHFASQNKVRRITTLKGPEDVFNDVKSHFEPYAKIDVLEANLKLLRAIDSQDWDTYSSLCDDHLTAFEPEGQGHLIEGLPFHKFYFDSSSRPTTNSLLPSSSSSSSFARPQSVISSPRVLVLDGGSAAVVTYVRLRQAIGSALTGSVAAFEETRVWVNKVVGERKVWKNVHFHRSRAPAV